MALTKEQALDLAKYILQTIRLGGSFDSTEYMGYERAIEEAGSIVQVGI